MIFECPYHQTSPRKRIAIRIRVRLPACYLDEKHCGAMWRGRVVKSHGHVVLQVLDLVYRSHQLCSFLNQVDYTRRASSTDPSTGDRMCLESCVDPNNAVIGDTCKPDYASRFIIAAMETSLSIRYIDALFD